MDQDLREMIANVARLGKMSKDEARGIMSSIYDDGIVSRGEAETLFQFRETLQNVDPMWGPRFAEAIKDYLLSREAPASWVTDEEADWLISQVEQSGDEVCLDDLDLLNAILRHAEGAPVKLANYTLNAVCERIKAAGRAASNLVERARLAIYAGSSDGGIWVSQVEAALLFETNDAIAFSDNDPEWNDLFSRAVANHLLARAHPAPESEADVLARQKWLGDTSVDVAGLLGEAATSFSSGNWFEKLMYSSEKARKARAAAEAAANHEAQAITDDEEAWVVRRMLSDGRTSPAEEALIDFLDREIPGFTAGLSLAA